MVTVADGGPLKAAFTVVSAFITTVQGLPAPQPPPVKPVKLAEGVAVRVIDVPSATLSEHVVCPAPPQSMPEPATFPDPVTVTVSVRCAAGAANFWTRRLS